MKSALVSLATLSLAALLPAVASGAPEAASSQAANVAMPIRTRAELARYLEVTPPQRSPLSLLPAAARKRFLDTLGWGSKGVGALQKQDLELYLTDAQIRRVLSLFGLEVLATQIHGRATPLTEAERDAPATPLERKFDQLFFLYFGNGQPPAAEASGSVNQLYDALFDRDQDPKMLASLSDSDAVLLFRAAGLAALMSKDPRYLDHLRLDLAELQRRGSATPEQVRSVHDALAAARRFGAAHALAMQYPAAGIVPLPPLRQAPNVADGDPTVLAMQPDRDAMWRKPVDMRAPLRIVVVAGCHFSVDAVQAISADPQLDELFHRHAVWLADEHESLHDVLDWNRAYPDHPMNVAWQNSEWTVLDSWSMPTFYIFRDGELMDKWSGWPADTGMQILREHLRAGGLLPATATTSRRIPP